MTPEEASAYNASEVKRLQRKLAELVGARWVSYICGHARLVSNEVKASDVPPCETCAISRLTEALMHLLSATDGPP